MKTNLNILVANGVNLDLLGQREKEIYGTFTLEELESYLKSLNDSFLPIFSFRSIKLHFFQSNNEADYLNKISQNWDGAILNPGAWTHTSLALGDRVKALKLLFTEVHISNLYQRENYRQVSYCRSSAVAVHCGAGITSYGAAFFSLLETLQQKNLQRN